MSCSNTAPRNNSFKCSHVISLGIPHPYRVIEKSTKSKTSEAIILQCQYISSPFPSNYVTTRNLSQNTVHPSLISVTVSILIFSYTTSQFTCLLPNGRRIMVKPSGYSMAVNQSNLKPLMPTLLNS